MKKTLLLVILILMISVTVNAEFLEDDSITLNSIETEISALNTEIEILNLKLDDLEQLNQSAFDISFYIRIITFIIIIMICVLMTYVFWKFFKGLLRVYVAKPFKI